MNSENNLSKYYVWDYVAWAFGKNKHIYNNLKINYIEEDLNIENNMLAVNNLSSLNICSYTHQNWITYIFATVIVRVLQFYFLPQVSGQPWASYRLCTSSVTWKTAKKELKTVKTKSLWCTQAILYQRWHLTLIKTFRKIENGIRTCSILLIFISR